MSTLAEIELAAQSLPAEQQEELIVFLVRRLRGQFGQEPAAAATSEDPLLAVMGAFPSGKPGPTGRNAEEILYGHPSGDEV